MMPELKYIVLIIIGFVAVTLVIIGKRMMKKKFDGRSNDEELEFLDLWDDD